ncbi:MAG: group 1 truncated hemoglobin [Gemmatimonadetes bacterium]|nr:group 1 truncated hemoglobin [Gemmatimonadota bacterium]
MQLVQRTRQVVLVALVAAAGACASAGGLASGGTADGVKLYKRLGGYDALAAVTDDFLGRILVDSLIAPYFKGLEPWQKTRVRQMIVDQLCEATGGPCQYVGRPMGLAHEQLTIDDQVWNAFAGHFVATLTKFRVPDREQRELLEIIGSMKGDIVRAGR